MSKKLLFRVDGKNPKECRWEYYTASGKGGQKRNRSKSAARVTHLPSGAVGQASESRSLHDNKRKAFRRMAETKKFKLWHQKEVAIRTGEAAEVERKVEEMMAPHNLNIEVRKDGKWKSIDQGGFNDRQTC